MEKLFADLAKKCFENNLKFEFIPASKGVIVSDGNSNIIASCWIDAEQAESELKWVQRQVDVFVQKKIAS